MDAFAAARIVVPRHPRLHSPHSAMLSAIINALTIVALLPLGLRGPYKVGAVTPDVLRLNIALAGLRSP